MEIVSSGIVAVPSGVSSTGLYVIQEGVLEVRNGGWAQDIGLAEGGRAVVSKGGILYVCTVSSGGTATLLNGGYAQDITVENGGLYLVSSGGTAHQSLIQSGGTQIVYADVMAASATVLDGGVLEASSGAYVRIPVVSQGGALHVRNGALVDGAKISGLVEVDSKATVNSAAVLGGGKLAVLTGGYAYEAKISSGGSLDISSGGRANYASVFEGGAIMVFAGASCLNADLNGGRITLAGAIAPADPETEAVPGGFASNTTVNSGGSLIVSSGATATKIKENGGYVQVANGANVTFTPNTISDLTLSNTSATIHSGTTATETTVNSDGKLEVFSGGMASGVTENGGYVYVADGADVTFTPNTISGLVLSNAAATVHAGTTATDATVTSGGKLEVFSGGKATGQMSFEDGAVVSAYDGAILDFDISGLTTEEGVRVNNLAVIQGTLLYTLTVSAEQAKGVYTLAEGAAGFAGSITVQNVSGDALGTLALGDKLITEDAVYTLNLGTETAADALTLTVKQNDTTPPVITLSADTETVLKQTTLTATVDDGSEIYFRISESGVWKKYTGPIIASFNETYYFKATDEAGNEGTNQITFGNIDTTGILLSTLWTQRGVCPMGGNTTVCYDEYTPYDPSVTPDTHSLVGCVNVAVGQLIYYFIEKQGLDLALTLKDSDEYISSHSTEEGDPIVIDIKSDGSTPGTLSFAAINEYLSAFELDSAEHAAALLYACGVVHKSKYAAASTGASWKKSTFTRSGFKCVNTDGPYMGMGYYYWGYWDDDFKIHISDAGYEVLIENLEAGRVVGAAYHGHALVIDGYDREDDTFHINFGWGYNQATRWYTREGIFELQLFDFVYDLMVDYVETFTVTDARLYGTGTMLRAFEQASGMAGANTVVFDSSVAGKTVELENNIKVTDETTVNGFNMNVLVTSVFTDELPAYGVYSEKGGILTFHASGGSLIVSTTNEYHHAFDMSDALSGTVTADNTLIYAGRNSEGAAAVLQSLQASRSNNAEVSEDLLDPNGWSFYGSTGNDVFTLSNSSIAVGNVSLGDGDDVLTLTGHSRLYGTIDAGDGNDSITVDSTSSISGDLSGKCNLSFVLVGLEGHALFTVKKSVSDLYSNATLSVDVTDAKTGICTLVSAASGATGIKELQNMVFTVVCSGAPAGTLAAGETLSVGGTDYTLNLNEASLTLTIKEEEPVPPVPENLVGTKDRVSWDPAGTGGYVVEYSTDNFAHGLQVAASTNAVDMLALPAGKYQWRVKLADGDQWADGNGIESDNTPEPAKVLRSNADGRDDLFFASASGTWSSLYYALHAGSVNDWAGTNEVFLANGKNRITDLFFGSDDANILCLTDDENGDGIFVDDEYTELPEGIVEQQARIARIDEIRAGAGDDIVDMTSNRIEYTGDGLTIRGGDGNDVIWANKGDNMLFGDAGIDRIVGASGNDVIAGGIGNDRLHGGGGADTFVFCENFGTDTVQQLESGLVTLWFASGSLENWDAGTLTYTDGENSVTVSGVAADRITLRFGDDDSAQYDDLVSAGAFLGFSSKKIFEENDQGILA